MWFDSLLFVAEHVGIVLTILEVSTRYDYDDASGLYALFLSLFLLHALSAIYIHLLISLIFSCGFVAVFRFELFVQPMWLSLISCTQVVNIKTSYFLFYTSQITQHVCIIMLGCIKVCSLLCKLFVIFVHL